MIQEAMADITSELEEHPEKVFPTLRFIRSSRAADDPEPDDDPLSKRPAFPGTYVRLNQVPNQVVFKHLVMMERNKFQTSEFCAKLERQTKGVCHALWCMALCVQPGTKWPKFGHDRETFDNACMAMYTEGGSRLQHIEFDYTATGEPYVNWRRNSIFMLEPPGECKKTSLRHRYGATVDLNGSALSIQNDEFSFASGWLECAAKVQHGKIEVGLAALFPDSVSSSLRSVRATENMSRAAIEEHTKLMQTLDGSEGAALRGGAPADLPADAGEAPPRRPPGAMRAPTSLQVT